MTQRDDEHDRGVPVLSPDSDDTVELEHDWADSESLVVTILDGLERVSGLSGDSFAPLHGTVDVGALATLFEPTGSGGLRGPGNVSFQVAEFTVAVHSDGTVLVGPTGQ